MLCGMRSDGSPSSARERAACAGDARTHYFMDSNGDTVRKDSASPADDSGPSMHVNPATGRVENEGHCVEVSEAGAALCFAWRIDNTGPHSIGEADLLFDAVRVRRRAGCVGARGAWARGVRGRCGVQRPVISLCPR